MKLKYMFGETQTWLEQLWSFSDFRSEILKETQNLLSPNESKSLRETWLTNNQATWSDGIKHKIPAISPLGYSAT